MRLATAMLLVASGFAAQACDAHHKTPPASASGGSRDGLAVSTWHRLSAGKARPRPRLTRPASRDLHRQPVPHTLNWPALARCESSGNPHAVSLGRYFGLYQFDLPTWASVGGTGNPATATPAEQTHRAELLYADRGTAPWPICGRYL